MKHGLLALAIAFGTLTSQDVRAQGVDTVVADLNYPWDVEASDGAFYITEKSGDIVVVRDGAVERFPVVTSEPILDDRGGGLLGLALLPDFDETGRVVLYQHYGTTDRRLNRVVEAELREGAWHETRVLVDAIPGHPLYNGGRVAIGPDGMLYITTGWTEDRDRPQNLDSLAGKILRVTLDGGIPSDNPFPGSPIWSLGHRNPQGIAWDSGGQLFAAEHGQSGHDEFNRIDAGGNYGWPLIQGDQTRDGLHTPIAHSGGRTWAPSGLAWDGTRLLLAGLKAQGIVALQPDDDQPAYIAYPADDRLRDVLVVDGTVYAITTNRSPRRNGASDDRLIRFTP